MQVKTFRFLAVLQVLAIFMLVPLGRPLQNYVNQVSSTYPALRYIALGLTLVCAAYVYWHMSLKVQRINWFYHLLGGICALSLFSAYLVTAAEWLHLPLYSFLACFVRLSMNAKSSHAGLLVVIACSLIGITDELLQWLHPERVFDIRDLALNFAAVLFGLYYTNPFIERSSSDISARS